METLDRNSELFKDVWSRTKILFNKKPEAWSTKKINEVRKVIHIVGADPFGSILGGGNDIKPYNVEGIGYDFIPDVLENNLVDKYIKTDDKNSFLTARELIKKEGLFIGGSCGSAVWACLLYTSPSPRDS